MLTLTKTKSDVEQVIIGLHLTTREVAERLGISVETAHALVVASLKSIQESA